MSKSENIQNNESKDERSSIPKSLLQNPVSRTKIQKAGFNPDTIISQIAKGEVNVDHSK